MASGEPGRGAARGRSRREASVGLGSPALWIGDAGDEGSDDGPGLTLGRDGRQRCPDAPQAQPETPKEPRAPPRRPERHRAALVAPCHDRAARFTMIAIGRRRSLRSVRCAPYRPRGTNARRRE
jgi:hypothetical protein